MPNNARNRENPDKPSKKPLPLRAEAWKPPHYEIADISAMQALARGDANPDQQERALRWIIEAAAGAYDMSYRPGLEGERDTVFAEGRRFVGLAIVKLLKLNPAKLAD